MPGRASQCIPAFGANLAIADPRRTGGHAGRHVAAPRGETKSADAPGRSGRAHMHALSLLLFSVFTAAAPAPREAAPRPPENLLAGPARAVLRYLEAVRLAGPYAVDARPGRRAAADERAYAVAKKLTAPRTLDEIDRWAARGDDHPLAPWREAARARVLESFQLVAVRRSPRATAVVSVRERYRLVDPDAAPDRTVSEYLVARVNREWKVVDRRAGGAFDDRAIEVGYAGFFDPPPGADGQGHRRVGVR